MPRQNRVTPTGALIATPARGTLMGNRGVLHDDEGRIVRAWRDRRWICCVLAFKDRKRQVMSPGHYTELFFLDEATALAAGHRPCAECQRDRFNAFRDAWLRGKERRTSVSAAEIDARLHAERLEPGGTKRTYRANLDDLPDGVFVQLPEKGEDAWLLWKDRLLAWSPGGYRERLSRPQGVEVALLTPTTTVVAIWAGYTPEVHGSL
jgi:hypothetical protein